MWCEKSDTKKVDLISRIAFEHKQDKNNCV